MNSEQKHSLIIGGLLIVLGSLLLAQTLIVLNIWVWVAAFGVCGLGVLTVYLTDRNQWWMLIVAYVLLALASLISGIELGILSDSVIALFVLTAVGLPFLYVYLQNRSNWWALIPSYVLIVVGLMVALIETGVLNDLLIPVYILFAIAIPFFVVYISNNRNWWALIPAGVLTLIGFVFLVFDTAVKFIAPIVLILVGAILLLRQFMDVKTIDDEATSEYPKEIPEKSDE